ncbi:MAG TPA: hypothetical protein VFK42_13575 [Acidimicrobiales bacterium]|jgi:hypothetical protein|nr:hypothetical protein [Acidimicrobiales bacterium]
MSAVLMASLCVASLLDLARSRSTHARLALVAGASLAPDRNDRGWH